MADIRALRSYLVSLGFSVNTAQAAQFNNTIKTAAQVVNVSTGNMAANFLKLGVTVVGAFEAMGIAVGALIEKTAKADQEYRLFAERMFMSVQSAKTLDITLKTLGVTLEQAAFDPEINRRVRGLRNFQNERLAPMLGPDFAQTMVQVRDAMMEFSRFRIEALYFRDLLVKDIFQALGGEKLTAKLRDWNEYIVQHMPEWSRIISTYIVPVLKDAWQIMKDLWEVAVDFAQIFTNIIGFLSGDPALEGTVSFEKFASALEKCTHFLARVIHYATKFAGTIAGALIGFSVGGPVGIAVGASIGAATDAVRSGFSHDEGTGETTAASVNTAALTGGPTNLDAIAHGVSMVESGGRQTDRSGRTIMGPMTRYGQAVGMMQLLPSTAAQLGVNPYNAAENYAGGREYLAQMYGKFGNWHDALAAYNWGPGNVQNALRKHRAFPASVEQYASNAMANAGVHIDQINIMQPNATPEQIAHHIDQKIIERQNKITSANLLELRSIYG